MPELPEAERARVTLEAVLGRHIALEAPLDKPNRKGGVHTGRFGGRTTYWCPACQV